MPWTHPRTEQACLCPLGPQGPHSPPHVPGGCYGPSPQVRKPQGPGRRGQAGSGQASLVPEARSWHLTVWGAQGSFLLGNWLLGRCRPARPPPGLDEEGPRVNQARTHLASFLHGRASQPATRVSAHPPWEHSPVLSWDWGEGGSPRVQKLEDPRPHPSPGSSSRPRSQASRVLISSPRQQLAHPRRAGATADSKGAGLLFLLN